MVQRKAAGLTTVSSSRKGRPSSGGSMGHWGLNSYISLLPLLFPMPYYSLMICLYTGTLIYVYIPRAWQRDLHTIGLKTY